MPGPAKNLRLQVRLSKRCRRLRDDAGMSQNDVALGGGFSLSHYQKIEGGIVDPHLSVLARIADVFGLSLAELMKGL